MKDRIKQYIDYKEITAGELAVKLDVQRSNISHILNGRNKPGAALIEKLLLEFPDLNARWLLTGNGNMIEVNTDNTSETKTAQTLSTENETKEKVKPAEVIQKIAKVDSPALSSLDDVEKMILLYKDGTFVTYSNRDKKIRY